MPGWRLPSRHDRSARIRARSGARQRRRPLDPPACRGPARRPAPLPRPRSGALEEALQATAPNVRSQRLRRLEGEGLVIADPYSERPPRFVYELTAAGRELAGALRMLADWGARHREGADPPRHAACGSPVEARWWCPTCERPVDEEEAADLHFA